MWAWTLYLFIFLVTIIFLGCIYFMMKGRSQKAFWEKRGVQFLKNDVSWWDIITQKKSFIDRLYYQQLTQEGKAFAGVYEQGQPSFFVTDPDLIKVIFVKDFDHFVDRREFKTSDPMMNKMVVGMEGQEWKDLRNFLTPTFTSGKLRRMFGAFNSSGEKLREHVARIQIDTETKGHVITIPEVARRFTVDVIGSTVFGMETNALSDPNSIFYKLADRAAKPGKLLIMKFLLFFLLPKIAQLFKIAPFDTEVTSYFRGILSEALKQRKQSGEKRDDFLQLMVEARKGELVEDGEVPKGPSQGTKFVLDDDTVMAQCFLFFFAGFDTVSNLISLSCYVLAADKGLQDKVRQNVKTAISQSGGDISYESANKMDYLDMFISEVQRMYGTAPRLERKCTQDYKIAGTDVTIPKGTIVMIDPEKMHFDEKFYPNPETIDPTRFSPEEKAKRNPYVFLPFGLGPRNCIGMRFALLEVKVALAHLVINFEILPTPKTPIPVKMDRMFGAVRVPKDLQICLKFRKSE